MSQKNTSPATKQDIYDLQVVITKDFSSKKDVKELQDTIVRDFASKQDITDLQIMIKRDFATKQAIKDLQATISKDFATKKDLEKFATKKELKKFATKIDLKNLEKRIDNKFEKFGVRMFQTFLTRDEANERFNRIEERLDALPTKDDLFAIVDSLVGTKKVKDTEMTALQSAHIRLDTRVTKIENQLGIS